MKLMLAFATTALCLVPTSVLNARVGSDSGQNIFHCEATTLPLDEGHSLVLWKGKGITVATANKPDNMSTIECAGTIENMADKSSKAAGYCLHTDHDGDKWIDRWWNDSSMKKARWEATGLSGKWKGVSSNQYKGEFVFTDLSTTSECKGVSTWETTE
jgi:hypothetical protein